MRAVWASAGAIGTRAGTQAILGDKNAGALGYVGNAAVAFGLGIAGEKFIGASAGDALFLGGVIGLVLRIAKEKVFAASPLAEQLQLQGLGDADFALSDYVNDPVVLPTSSAGPDQMTVTPVSYWAHAVAPPSKGLQGLGAPVERFRSPWA